MRLFYKISSILVLSTAIVACDKVPAGYQGVLVNLYGSDKGIQTQSLGTGRYWVGPNQELYLFPVFLQNYTWDDVGDNKESITMQTSEGLSINTDVGITYQINPENVSKVFQKYRKSVEEITNIFLRNMVRDAMNEVASTMTVEDIYGLHKNEFITAVNQRVKADAIKDGIYIDKIYLIGSFRLPETVVNSINSKIQASQNAMKVENEVATAKAEAQKTIINAQAGAQAEAQKTLIVAESRAKANKILSESITPQYLQFQALSKWDGKLPQYTGSGAVPFLNLNKE